MISRSPQLGPIRFLPGSEIMVGVGLWEKGSVMITKGQNCMVGEAPGCYWSSPTGPKGKPRAGRELTVLQPQAPKVA